MGKAVRVLRVLIALVAAYHAVKLCPHDLKKIELPSGANELLRRPHPQPSEGAAASTAARPQVQRRSPPSTSILAMEEKELENDVKPHVNIEDHSRIPSEVVRKPSEKESGPGLPGPTESNSKGPVAETKEMATSTVPHSLGPPEVREERTLAFKQKRFMSGFRNAGMAFTWFVMYASENNYTSILLNNLNWKDLYGMRRPWGFAPHDALFDVDHWNSHFPTLPRIVPYDPNVHDQYDPKTMGPVTGVAEADATRPTFAGTYLQGFNQYRMYTRRVTNNPSRYPRSPVETAMMQGAFRPSQEMQAHMDRLTGGAPYLALHARVEPDMQNHPVCRDKKVLLLSDIVSRLESYFPDPKFGRVFVATNRPMLEYEAESNLNNTIAAANLVELNRIRDRGMWNGTVAVFEAGSSLMRVSGGPFQEYSGIAGAVIDYFLALGASAFVGTEVSSFTADLVQSRFFRGNRRNFHYRPEGIVVATTDSDRQPPRFAC